MSATAKLTYFFRTATGSMVRSPFVHVIAISALTLALLGYGATRIVALQLRALMSTLGGDVELTVYLGPLASAEKVAELEAALIQRTRGSVRRVSADEALRRLAADLGDEGKTLLELKDNPLPSSLEVKVPPSWGDEAELAALAEKTKHLDFVSGVDFGEEAARRLGLITRALSLAAAVAFALVFLTAIIVVSATLQLAIFARRDEIEIQKLVGGTDWFVRTPFLIEGVLQGLLSGVLALGLLRAAAETLERHHGAMAAFVLSAQPSGRTAVDWWRLGGEQVGLGLLLGLLGSAVAVRRFLRV